MRKTATIAALLACTATAPIAAKEGMFTPGQLPEIAEDLKETGLEIDPETLTDLTGFPMGAIVSLGGCSASFVSPEGLVVTNHHCARGSVQYNSTAENNYLENGFLAKAKGDELPAAPGSRIYVTTEITDVTARMRDGVDALSATERYDTLEQRMKDITAECEQDAGSRCQVASFYGGAEYTLIKRLEVRDVRLVYAPADSIGKYGGDIDNWMWPRHTGDFAFYRAYVAPDGSAADYSEDNVPYQPEHHLKVSAAGLDDGDFVMAAGWSMPKAHRSFCTRIYPRCQCRGSCISPFDEGKVTDPYTARIWTTYEPYMAIYCNIWSYMVHICPYMAIHGPYMVIYGQ